MTLCRKCQAEKQFWHPGPPFECEPLEICYACDLESCKLRADRLWHAQHFEHLRHMRQLSYVHQTLGTETLVKVNEPEVDRICAGCFALFDEMGVAKTKQCIDAACLKFVMNQIDRVIVVAPAAVRDVWFEQDLGELKKHIWKIVPSRITKYHASIKVWTLYDGQLEVRLTPMGHPVQRQLEFIITNYEFLRSGERLEALLPHCTGRTQLILDESSAVKNVKAEQTKACLKLRRKCGSVWLLNGTPIANSPLDMYAQGQLMDPRILECKTYFHFRSKYALVGGFQQRQIIGWQNLDDLQRRFKPYVLRRLKAECLDLPEKLEPVTLTVALTSNTWAIYREMRDEMVAWLSEQTVSVATQAGVKAMRLAQVCAGFIGGVEVGEPELDFELDAQDVQSTRPAFIRKMRPDPVDTTPVRPTGPLQTTGSVLPVQEIGREKLDALIDWIRARIEEEPNLKLLVWCRFRPEVERTLRELSVAFSHVQLGAIWGGQTEDRWKFIDGQRTMVKEGERGRSLRLLDPRSMPNGPAFVVGTTATGSMGINLSGAHTVIYLTNDFSLKLRLQSEDRVHRPGQVSPVSYTDVAVTGPKGQKTVDHIVLKALRNKEDVANWTTRAWISALTEDNT